MDPEHFPHAGAEREYYWADIYFANYHINHDKLNWLKNFDVADAHRLVDDFDRFDAGDWTINTTEAGSGSASEAITDLPCGFLLVTTDNADNDYDEILTDARSWIFMAGYPCYAEFRGKVGDGDETDLFFGFLNGSYFGAAATYGAYFLKPDGYRRLLFITEYNNVETAYDTGWDVDDLTCGRLGIHWDGAGNVRWFIYADTDAPRICLATGTCTVDIPTNVLFYAGFGIRNGEAEAKTLYVDYLKVAMKRIPCDKFDMIELRDLGQ